jgi:hypothetical protein
MPNLSKSLPSYSGQRRCPCSNGSNRNKKEKATTTELIWSIDTPVWTCNSHELDASVQRRGDFRVWNCVSSWTSISNQGNTSGGKSSETYSRLISIWLVIIRSTQTQRSTRQARSWDYSSERWHGDTDTNQITAKRKFEPDEVNAPQGWTATEGVVWWVCAECLGNVANVEVDYWLENHATWK